MVTIVSGRNYLEARISELEKVQAQHMEDLKMSASGLVRSLIPSNMLKAALVTVVQTPGLRNAALKTAVGLGVEYLGKKLFRSS